ncbi:MAG: envelope stress response membrane protein PspC [Sphingomonadales bacterium]|jgi:phage shock protein C
MAERTRFYRDKRNGKVLGVCAGIADYTGIDVLLVRIGMIILALSPASGITIITYCVLGCLTPIKPAALYDEPPEEKEFWRNMRTRPRATMHDVKMRFSEMEHRLRDMEAYVTSSRRDLDREIDKLRDA